MVHPNVVNHKTNNSTTLNLDVRYGVVHE